VLALIAATVFSLLSANRERLARQDAERNARVTASVNDFMNSMFSAAMPQEALGRDITVKEIVDQAVKQLQLQPPADATVDAQIALSLAQVYQVLGRFDEASELVASGIGRTEGKADLDATLLIELKMLAADLAGRKGDFKVYEQRARAAIAMVESKLGSDNLLYHKARNELAAALVYQSRHDEAAAIYESILRFPTSTPEANELHEEVQADFGVLKRDMGKYDEAEAIFTDAIAELTERLGSDHPSTLSALNNLATVRQRKGDLAGAQTDYEKALAGRIKVLGPDHPETLTVKQNLANLMILVGRQTEALPILQDLVERNRKVRGPTHPNSSIAAGALAWAYEDLGRLDEAEALYRDTLKLEAQAKSDFTEAFSTQQNFAMLLMKRDKLAEAATNFRGAIARAAPLLGDAHPYVLIYRNNYGECLTRMGRYDEALKLLRDSHSGLVTVFGADHERVKKSLARIAAAERG
jgi:tetratricopeptide (TPR) repeat protein